MLWWCVLIPTNEINRSQYSPQRKAHSPISHAFRGTITRWLRRHGVRLSVVLNNKLVSLKSKGDLNLIGDILEAMEMNFGYIYIGVNANDLTRSKVGFSRISPEARFIQRTNSPDYVLFRAYRIPLAELVQLEGHLHNHVSREFRRIPHVLTGTYSEWFMCHPLQAADIIEYRLVDCIWLPNDELGFDLSPVLIIPHYDHGFLFQHWRDEHVPFLRLFVDEFGAPLPAPTFRKWKGT